MFSGFQSNAFQSNAFQIIQATSRDAGGIKLYENGYKKKLDVTGIEALDVANFQLSYLPDYWINPIIEFAEGEFTDEEKLFVLLALTVH